MESKQKQRRLRVPAVGFVYIEHLIRRAVDDYSRPPGSCVAVATKELRLPPLSPSERLSEKQRDVRGPPPGRRRASDPRACWTSGYLSTWPAHISSQAVQQGRRDTRNHGCGDEFGGTVGKPRFLEQLESYLKRELQVVDPHRPQAQERRLQVYRQVFDSFIEDFKTYKPLLSAIKNQYEITLASLREQIRGLEPLQARLVIVSEQCEKRILGLREEERGEIRTLKQERQHLQKVIENMRETQISLQTQVSCLQEDLSEQYLLYREESDARKLLISNLSTVTYCPEEEEEPDHEQEEVESEDPVKVKLALKVCREDLSLVQMELNRLQAEYGDVVPRRTWECLDHAHNHTLTQMETLQKDFQQLRSELDVLLEVHRQVVSHRDSLQGELEGFKLASTPRPPLDHCTEALGGSEFCPELCQDQSSQRRLVGKTSEFYTGLGVGPEVPVYLRYSGPVKKTFLQQADVLRVIKEVWKEKVTEDQQRDESSDLAEFLSRHLERQHGEQAGSWAYSLAEALQRHHSHASISLFYSILTGKVDESVYHSQTQLLSKLLKVLINSDVTESGELSAHKFREVLSAAFPLKGDQDLEDLVAAAELDNNTGSISYQRLYTEDDEGRHREFLTLVKTQATAERHAYISQLRGRLGGPGEVTVADLRNAFQSIDPSLDSTTLDWNLAVAFQLDQRALDQQGALVETELALERLLMANVTRAGPVPALQHD